MFSSSRGIWVVDANDEARYNMSKYETNFMIKKKG